MKPGILENYKNAGLREKRESIIGYQNPRPLIIYEHAEHIWGERSETMFAQDLVGKIEDEDIERQLMSTIR